eukprot:1159548-Pelagomonas_calceolata.AAC.18
MESKNNLPKLPQEDVPKDQHFIVRALQPKVAAIHNCMLYTCLSTAQRLSYPAAQQWGRLGLPFCFSSMR